MVFPGEKFYDIKWYKIETFKYSSPRIIFKAHIFQGEVLGVVFAMNVGIAVTKM